MKLIKITWRPLSCLDAVVVDLFERPEWGKGLRIYSTGVEVCADVPLNLTIAVITAFFNLAVDASDVDLKPTLPAQIEIAALL